MIIYNAKIYTCDKNFTVFSKGFVEFLDGKITRIEMGNPQNISENDIDAKGGKLFPGFIDAHTHMGLLAGSAGIEVEDFNETTNPITPNISVIDAINPQNPSFYDALQNGITTVAVAPGSSNPIAGQICAIKCSGKRVDKMLIKTVGIKFSLGENPKMTYMDRDETPVTRMAVASCIRDTLNKALKYKRDLENYENDENCDEPEIDSVSEALIPLLNGEISAHFHCHRADDIFTAIRISKEYNLKSVLIHCTEGHLIADELEEEKEFPVVLGPIICDRNKPELANISTKNPAILSENGIKTAICTDHSEVPIEYLPLSCAIAIKNGMSKKNALLAITRIPAEILEISDRVGSIEVGKDADFCLYDKSPFDIMSKTIATFVNGKQVI